VKALENQPEHRRPMKPSNVFAVIAIATVIPGLADIGSATTSGFLRAIGAIFFIVAFITRLVEKAESLNNG
jgi:hypothetical protein